CAEYGAGVGLLPLAQIVESQLGDDAVGLPPEERLDIAIAGATSADAAWVRARLAPLLGLPGVAVERGEAFAAWTRFLELVAATNPLVLVLEDIHWADSTVLAFLEHLIAEASGPILSVCTARPSLLEDRAAWCRGRTIVQVPPLADDDIR